MKQLEGSRSLVCKSRCENPCLVPTSSGSQGETLPVNALSASGTLSAESPVSADSSLTPTVTHFGINTLALEIAGKRILIDPLLVGNLESWIQMDSN